MRVKTIVLETISLAFRYSEMNSEPLFIIIIYIFVTIGRS